VMYLVDPNFFSLLHKLKSPNVEIVTSSKTTHTLGNTIDEISTLFQVC
jgi:hypothetical protein